MLGHGDFGFIVAGRPEALDQQGEEVNRQGEASKAVRAPRETKGHDGRNEGEEEPEGKKPQEKPLLLFVSHVITYSE